MKNFTAVVLAAGEGTRMKSKISKVLHEICGIPMIEHTLNNLRSLNIDKIIVVAGKNFLELKNSIGENVVLVRQMRPRGTADALKAAKPRIKHENILVVYGDTPLLTKKTIFSLVKRHNKTRASASLLTIKVKNPEGYGRIIRNNSGEIVGIKEDKDLIEQEKKIEEVNAGLSCFNTKYLLRVLGKIKSDNKKKEYYLTDAVGLFAKENKKVVSLTIDDIAEAEGINNQQQLSSIEKVMRKRIIKKLMSKGVRFIDPDNTYIEANVKIGADTVIYPGAYIEKNCQIGSDCKIGPYAHIRSGTKIKNNVKIGNYAEVNRSFIDEGSQVCHFSYIGDARIGKSVNIGAGTVTANYDGKKKNKTIIEDNVFIGSGTILVAPVKIATNAITGAGSVITKNTKVRANSVYAGVPAKFLKKRG